MNKTIEPIWAGMLSAVSYLYALWAASNVYVSSFKGHGGEGGMMVMFVVLPMIFAIVMVVTVLILGLTLGFIKNTSSRSSVVLVALGIFLLGYGKPSIVVLIFICVFFYLGYNSAKKTHEDTDDLQTFFEQEAPKKDKMFK